MLRPEQILQQIESLKLLYPELVEDEWELSLESETEFKEFLRKVEQCRQNAVALMEAVQHQIDLLHERAKRFDRREQAMRKLELKLLEAADLRKIELPEATMSITAGRWKVIITDEKELPEEFLRNKPEPDKPKIREYLESGGTVPGAVISNPEPHLTVRVK